MCVVGEGVFDDVCGGGGGVRRCLCVGGWGVTWYLECISDVQCTYNFRD